MICNGHYSKKHFPEIENLDKFTGDILHSKDYRFPEFFDGKRVAIIGGRHSGNDIANQIATGKFLKHTVYWKQHLPIKNVVKN